MIRKKKSKSAKANAMKLVHQLCGILKSRDGSSATCELRNEHIEETLTPAQERWASKRHQGLGTIKLRKILLKQKGKCALSKVELLFDVKEGTPITGGKGCHPLYPAVDHIDPGSTKLGHQIVCYALNDLKGHLPYDCFKALKSTKAWKMLMEDWRKQSVKDKYNREAFKRLLRPNAKQI